MAEEDAGKEFIRGRRDGNRTENVWVQEKLRPFRCGCWKVQKRWGSEMCLGRVE